MMDFKKFYSLLFLCLWIGCSETFELQQHEGFALGTSYHFKYAGGSEEFESIQKGVDSLFFEINRSLSTYIKTSDISKINEGDTTIVVDHHFKKVFAKSEAVWRSTDGYFDPTLGQLVNAYGFGPEKPLTAIDSLSLQKILTSVGWEKIKLTASGKIVKHPSTYLDFNAIAKGYAVDCIANYLLLKKKQSILVEIGGELMAIGRNPKSGTSWKVAIYDPLQLNQRRWITTVELSDQGLATSGNYRKHRTDSLTGEKYVHSINPLTGRTVKTNVLSTSVLAPDCMTADAWATALMVLPLEKGQELIENHPKLEALWIVAKNDSLTQVPSSHWN
jgi:thiamine biosynthesis lipoprotein